MPETRNTRSAKKEPKTSEKRSQSASKSSKSTHKPSVVDSVAEQKLKAKEWAEKQVIFII